MNSIEVIRKIEKQELAACYLLVGPEKFFHDQIIHSLEKTLFKDASARGLNRIVLNGPETSYAEIVNASLAYPMLSDWKMVLVKEYNRVNVADQELFLKYLDAPQKASILVLQLSEAGRNAFYKKVASLAQLVECKAIKEYHMMPWAQKLVKEKDLKITVTALNMLLEYTGPNLLTLSNEIEKLKNYKKDNTEIAPEDIIALTGMSKEINIFALQEAIGRRDIRLSLKIGTKMLENGININAIIGILYAYFRKVLLLSYLKKKLDPAAVRSQLHMGDFQWKKMNAVSQNFSTDQIGTVISRLQECDFKTKNSLGDDGAILQDFLLFVCKK